MKHSWLSKLLLIVLIPILAVSGCKGSEKNTRQLNLYIWSAYIAENTLKRFEKETGIKVRFDTYDSNEALLEKMMSGVSDYDVIVPSDYMVRVLKRKNLLETLDHNRLPNLKNLSPMFRDLPYNPKNQNAVPFLWGTTGIGYDKTKVTDPVDTWSILWNPKYANRILMLDDPRECFGAALKWKGHSLNSTDPALLQEAQGLLIQQKPLVKTYSSSNFDEILLSGDVWLAHGWSGQLAKAVDQNKNLAYAIPREGTTIWVDNLAIPALSQHKDEAYAFLNFFLEPQIAAEVTNYSSYASTNEAAKAFIAPHIVNDPARYPDQATLARCEFIQDLGDATKLIDRLWTEMKSR